MKENVTNLIDQYKEFSRWISIVAQRIQELEKIQNKPHTASGTELEIIILALLFRDGKTANEAANIAMVESVDQLIGRDTNIGVAANVLRIAKHENMKLMGGVGQWEDGQVTFVSSKKYKNKEFILQTMAHFARIMSDLIEEENKPGPNQRN